MLLTIRAAAKALTLSERAVRRLIADGILPIVPLTSRRVAIPEQAIKDYTGVGRWQYAKGVSQGVSRSSSNKAVSAYLSVCRPVSRRPKRRSGKRSSEGKYSTDYLVGEKSR